MDLITKIISLSKRRGFIFPGSEIYGGLAGTWDYGPLGVLLKNNIKNLWWHKFVLGREDILGLESSILMNTKVWEASGHLKGFADKLVECKKCHKRFKIDFLKEKKCPECKGEITKEKEFNTMFKSFIGPVENTAAQIYLRPETAQGMFVNFKNIIDSFHPKLPFGIAQIGKVFRNEINPENFIFRIRELEQMEIEYFVHKKDWQKWFNYWLKQIHDWIREIGINKKNIFNREVKEKDRAHYSDKTIDIDYNFPFGKEELYGLAYRTDFDLKVHNLSFYDQEKRKIYFPHVIEPSFGLERTILALFCEAYKEDEIAGEKRVLLKFNSKIAPIKIAVFPLLSNKPKLVRKARQVYENLKIIASKINGLYTVWWDDIGNIGKRYRRQDEIGTPFCITIDFQTLEDNTVTVRDRDTTKQERVVIHDLFNYFQEKF